MDWIRWIHVVRLTRWPYWSDAESAETLIFGFVHICMRAEVRVTSARMVLTGDSAHSLPSTEEQQPPAEQHATMCL